MLTPYKISMKQTTPHDDVIKWKHFPRYWPFVRGIHRPPVNSPHKGQWRGTFQFSLICARMNCWVNNREAGDLRRHRAHYDVIVMKLCHWRELQNGWKLLWVYGWTLNIKISMNLFRFKPFYLWKSKLWSRFNGRLNVEQLKNASNCDAISLLRYALDWRYTNFSVRQYFPIILWTRFTLKFVFELSHTLNVYHRWLSLLKDKLAEHIVTDKLQTFQPPPHIPPYPIVQPRQNGLNSAIMKIIVQ